ncbi:MAG: glycine zipper 2TM domain-containing protein [Planctomycetes bacterium]|nr:glycine zipper 2TM domain-containing protein [Planctomycetota bacterium]
MRRQVAIGLVLFACSSFAGCTSSTGQGALIGGGGGALIGGLAGGWKGAAIGAAAGAVTGAVIGHEVGKVKYCPACYREFQRDDAYCAYDGTQLVWR